MTGGAVREPAVAGLFYPGTGAQLAAEVKSLLGAVVDAAAGGVGSAARAAGGVVAGTAKGAGGAAASPQPGAGSGESPPSGAPKALIAPHAGYVYSGPIAASAYALLAPAADRIRRVVLVGPAHRVWFRGVALPGVMAFRTPLGDVEVDQEAAARIADLPQVSARPDVHRDEHSLEVHLPFLQRLLPDFRVVPLVVGEADAGEVAEVLERLWGGEETLIVISSDLSHYLPYAAARSADAATARAILALDPTIEHEQACGGTPVNGLLALARRKRLVPTLLDLRNSGDTAGDRSRVVGYAAFAFHERDASSQSPDRSDERSP